MAVVARSELLRMAVENFIMHTKVKVWNRLHLMYDLKLGGRD
jgi:hypothetical protein